VRELTKVLDGATNAHCKSLICTIEFVLDTKLFALRLSPFTKKDGSLFTLIVNLLVIEKLIRVFLVLLLSYVVLPFLGNPNHVTVLPYPLQKLNIMLVLKQLKKWCSSKVFWKLLEKKKVAFTYVTLYGQHWCYLFIQ
jgi:hypothetical protein